MSAEKKDRGDGLSRRLLLQGTMAAISAAAVIGASPRPASATIKISKAAVAYQDHPEGDKRCGKCLQFVAPSSCKMVDGPVSPEGFCRIFTPLRQASLSTQIASPAG
jgi:hypothetical protein